MTREKQADGRAHPRDFAEAALRLVEQMSVSEKAALMSGSSFWHLQDLPQYGLGKTMVSDGPHGLRKQGSHADHLGMLASVPATCFPTAVTLASSWDVRLIEEVGHAIGLECRAENVAVLLGPGVNIKRNPLCGRNFEYYSEDPYQAGQMAIHFIKGVQSTGTGTSLKHFAANNQEAHRMVVDTLVDRRTLFEIYLPAFEAAVTQAQPWTVMSAYNRLNGIYCSEHEELLGDILRGRFGFQGLVVTDWGAVNNRPRGIAAGLELEMPSSGGQNDARVVAAIANGTLAETALDKAAAHIVRLTLAAQNNAGDTQIDFDAHHALARKTAGEGAVLLKNRKATLPFKKDKTLALIGAFAETPRFQGAGSSQVNATRIDTPLALFREAIGVDNVFYAPGYDAEFCAPDAALIDEAVAIAEKAEQVVVMAGLPALFEAEGYDRTSLRQPPQMEALIEAVLAANPNCVIALSNGAPVEMPWHDQANAILETYLAGQAGAGALVDLLLGDVNPSGKLAETFPLALADCPSQENFANHNRQLVYREGLNVGYRYFITHEKPVLFPFGHGLSYTQFDYGEITLSGTPGSDEDALSLSLDITNSGAQAGAEIVQLYVRDVDATAYRPDRELKGFDKVFLQAGETKRVRFTLPRRAFAYFDIGADDWLVEPGAFDILIGASSTDIRRQMQVAVADSGARNQAALAETPYVVMDDAALNRLGLRVSVPEQVRPYHGNTTLADIKHHWLGRRVVAAVMGQMAKTLGSGGDSAVVAKMREEMILSIRLQTVQIMSNGAITPKRFELLLHALNNQWLKFLWRLIRRGK